MGSTPRTKSEYRKKIAQLECDYEYCKRAAKTHPGGDWAGRASSIKQEIIKLKAKMADAPKD